VRTSYLTAVILFYFNVRLWVRLSSRVVI